MGVTTRSRQTATRLQQISSQAQAMKRRSELAEEPPVATDEESPSPAEQQEES